MHRAVVIEYANDYKNERKRKTLFQDLCSPLSSLPSDDEVKVFNCILPKIFSTLHCCVVKISYRIDYVVDVYGLRISISLVFIPMQWHSSRPLI